MYEGHLRMNIYGEHWEKYFPLNENKIEKICILENDETLQNCDTEPDNFSFILSF